LKMCQRYDSLSIVNSKNIYIYIYVIACAIKTSTKIVLKLSYNVPGVVGTLAYPHGMPTEHQ